MTADQWTTTHGDRVTVYRSEIGDGTIRRPLEQGWRYRIQARNGQVVETGSEGYVRRSAAVRAARRHHPMVES